MGAGTKIQTEGMSPSVRLKYLGVKSTFKSFSFNQLLHEATGRRVLRMPQMTDDQWTQAQDEFLQRLEREPVTAYVYAHDASGSCWWQLRPMNATEYPADGQIDLVFACSVYEAIAVKTQEQFEICASKYLLQRPCWMTWIGFSQSKQ